MKTVARKKAALLWFYAAAAAAFALVCGARLARDSLWLAGGELSGASLDLRRDSAASSGIHFSEDFEASGVFTSSDPDPWIAFEWEGGRRLNRVVFEGDTAGRAGGALCVYYTAARGEAFSPKRIIWARRGADGAWNFDLDGRRVYALRLDPGTAAGAEWHTAGVLRLNERLPVWEYFAPRAWQVFMLLFAPPLAWGAAYEAAAFIGPALARRRFEERWRGERRA